jgi:hypothetical protein
MTTLTLTRTQVYLNPDVVAKAKKVAKTKKVTFSNILRQALQDFLIKSETKVTKPKLTLVNLKDKAVRNYSERVNEIYDI